MIIINVITSHNAKFITTKYVSNIVINPNNGDITITFASPAQIAGRTLVYTPSIGQNVLVPGLWGNMDWACASTSNTTATNRGMPATIGTIPARFVPSECK